MRLLAALVVIPWLPLRPPAPPPPPPLAPPCAATMLRAAVSRNGAGGSLLEDVRLRNAGRAPCSLLGRPRVELTGGESGGQPLRVAPLPALRPDPLALADRPSTLRALPPGHVAVLSLWWSNWCGSRPPTHVTVALPGGKLQLPLADAPRCDDPSGPTVLRERPFAPAERSPAPSTRLPLRAAVVGVPPREPKLAPPRLRVRAGGVLRFRLALANTSTHPFRFRSCPLATVLLAPSVASELLVLNCGPAGAIPARGRAVFALELRVPPGARPGDDGLAVEVAPRTYAPPWATARVLVTR